MKPDRILPIKSAYNFRDLGGYKGANGRYVKQRSLIRSSDFPILSNDDKAYLSAVPILSVVDFRSEDEIAQQKDCLPGSVRNVYHFSIDAGNMAPHFKNLLADPNVHPDEILHEATKLMNRLYRELAVNYSNEYKSFFDVLQHGEAPLLFHCSAGKDRTGVAAALLLLALGVERKTIYEDYLLTNDALKGKYDHLKEYGPIVNILATVRKEFLETAFEEIEQRHGSIDNYLIDELNVDLKKMRELYLEM